MLWKQAFDPRTWFGPLQVARMADEHGLVRCPVKVRDVEVAGCEGCAFLHDVVRDGQGTITEIVCRPSMTALTSGAAQH